MGREAACRCVCGEIDALVKALLESRELIIRGPAPLRHRWSLGALAEVRVEGETLRFVAEGQAVTLHLGSREAAAWARKIASEPPTLATKLGLSVDSPALLIGDTDDAALLAALDGAVTDDAGRARQLIAVVLEPADLAAALALHASLDPRIPLWILHRKGRHAGLGDGAIRTALRQGGYVDSKISAVSEQLSATRYSLRRGPAA